MKNSLLIAILCLLSSCGANMYNSLSSGLDNCSYIIILSDNRSIDSLTLSVDGKQSIISKIHKVKNKRKSTPIVITPGKHNIKVLNSDSIILEENIFIGLQETKKIIIR